MIPLMSEEFEKDHPVTAQTIKCFAIGLGASCNVLVFLVAPIVTIILVVVRIISPWWLFLGCGPLALGLCLSCCAGCTYCIVDCYVRYVHYVCLQERMKAKRLKNEAITQAAPCQSIKINSAGLNIRSGSSAELLAMCCPSVEFEEEHPVAVQTIECFVIGLGISCVILVFLVAPIVTIILAVLRIISPWWLFLGCGPLALMLCLSLCCYVCAKIAMFIIDYYNCGPAKKNKPINQSASV
ncbi:hypothetical protein Ddc_10519 [Ditylenchus destructor]|nr:hypothetical protein Ddc_10519 [Ditylenchus destructor]